MSNLWHTWFTTQPEVRGHLNKVYANSSLNGFGTCHFKTIGVNNLSQTPSASCRGQFTGLGILHAEVVSCRGRWGRGWYQVIRSSQESRFIQCYRAEMIASCRLVQLFHNILRNPSSWTIVMLKREKSLSPKLFSELLLNYDLQLSSETYNSSKLGLKLDLKLTLHGSSACVDTAVYIGEAIWRFQSSC